MRMVGRTGQRTNQITVLKLHKLLGTLVLVNRVVVGYNTLAVHRSLNRLCLLVKWELGNVAW